MMRQRGRGRNRFLWAMHSLTWRMEGALRVLRWGTFLALALYVLAQGSLTLWRENFQAFGRVKHGDVPPSGGGMTYDPDQL
jgi:hypothetical protein